MTNLAELIGAIESLDDDFDIFYARSSLPSVALVNAAQSQLDLPLDSGHRGIINHFGCLVVLAKESVWPRPHEHDINPAWRFRYGIEIFGVAEGVPEALDVVAQSQSLVLTNRPLVALMRTIGGPVIAYDPDGVLWLHDPCDEQLEQLDSDGPIQLVLDRLNDLAADKHRVKASMAG